MSTHHTLFKLSVLPAILLLMSCAGKSYHVYQGEQRQASELATIKPWHDTRFNPIGSVDVWPASIDDRETEPYAGAIPSYFVLPGEHQIRVGYYWTSGDDRVSGFDPQYMVFTAEAGHLYVTKASMPKKIIEGQIKVSFYIEDETTKQVVAGTRLQSQD